MEGQEPTIFRTRLDASGRIVLPAETRARRNLKEGDTVLVVEDEQGLHVKSLDDALADAQAYFSQLAPASVVLSDEINNDRRSRGSVTSVVLDASALMALLRSEPGMDIVRKHVAHAAMSAVNFSEVLKKTIEYGGQPQQAIAFSRSVKLEIVQFDDGAALAAASLYPVTKPYGLSFADRACLSLGLARKALVLTTEKDMAEVDLPIKVRRIRGGH